jgi:hypothetical protein
MTTTMTDTLRQAVRASGLPVLAVAEAAGVAQPRLHTFVKGGDMYGRNLDKLAAYFGLELRPRKGTKGAKR